MSSQSSTRSSAVKSTIKVYSEMKENQSCKLALRSIQLKIVLGTYQMFYFLDRLKIQRLQHYFDVLLYNSPQKLKIIIPSKQSSQSFLTPPVKKKSVKFHVECSPASCLFFKQLILKKLQRHFSVLKHLPKKPKQAIKLLEVIENLYVRNTSIFIKNIKRIQQTEKGLRKISTLLRLKTRKYYYVALFKMAFIGEFNLNFGKVSIRLVKEAEEYQDWQVSKPITTKNDCGVKCLIASTNEQLSMKFASASIITGILNQKIIKSQFAFFFHARQSKPILEMKSLDGSDMMESPEDEKLKPQIIAAHKLFHILENKFRENLVFMGKTLIPPSNISIQYYKQPRNSIKLFQNSGNQKLQAFVKKMFNEKEKLSDTIKSIPGIQLVAEYEDVSKSQISAESSNIIQSDSNSNSQSVNTMEDSETSRYVPVKQPQVQIVKKERISQAIQNYCNKYSSKEVSPAQIQKVPPQKPPLQKQEKEKSMLRQQISIIILILIIFLTTEIL